MDSIEQAEYKKQQVSTTVEPLSDPIAQEEQSPSSRPSRHVRQAVWTIVSGVGLPSIPIIIILIVLFYFIFHYQVRPWPGYPEFQLMTNSTQRDGFTSWLSDVRHQGGSAAYLVRYNPSTLVTIASWTSRIIPYLTSSIMALVAFFAARYLVQQSKRGENAVLPDPEQLTILIGLLSGSGIEPMKDALFHKWLKKKQLIQPVPAAFWVFLFIMVLGLVMPIVDTWFGVATHPLAITLFSNTTTPKKYARQLDTFGETSPCPNGPRSNVTADLDLDTYWPCNLPLSVGASIHMGLADYSEATKLQYGLPTSTMISSYNHSSQTWYFYTDPTSDPNLDFRASTPAISTQCTPMTRKCLQSENGNLGGGPFECSSGFRGNWTKAWPYMMTNQSGPETTAFSATGIAFANDAELSATPGLINSSMGPTWPEIIPQNPIYFGTWGINYPGPDVIQSLLNDPEILFWSGGTEWYLNCTSTVANLTYTRSNGTITAVDHVLVSPEMAALFMGQFSLISVVPYFANIMNPVMTRMATLAALSDNMTQAGNVWASEFSKNALALTVGVFVPLQNSLEQHREVDVIVARVPLVPLYLLVALKLIYVVAVIVLAIGAYAFTHPSEVEVVRAQLSTKGLAAAHFDQPDLLQQNAVEAVQNIVANSKDGKTDDRTGGSDTNDTAQPSEPAPGLKRAATVNAETKEGKTRVGLVPDADGVWKFSVLAHGVWHSIEPMVNTLVVTQAEKGNLGSAGGVINAWR